MTGAAGVATAAAAVLAVTFVWAGVAKLARPGATAAAVRRLGLPAAALLGVAIPGVELALAGVLLVRPRSGGAAALLLLAAFSGFLATRRARGQQVGCGCFGATGAASRSAVDPTALAWVDLLRNAGLAVLAGVALAAPAWSTPDLAAVITVSTGVAAGGVALALADLRARTGRLWATAALLDRGGER